MGFGYLVGHIQQDGQKKGYGLCSGHYYRPKYYLA